MKNIYIQLPGKIFMQLSSSSEFEINEDMMLLANAYLPGIRFTESKPKTIQVIIRHIQSNTGRIRQKRRTIILEERWEKELPLDFYHLLYGILRVKLLEKQLCPVHAACIGKNKFSLMVGHSGSGKTALTLNLAKRRMKIFSTNKTVVDFRPRIFAIAGTLTVTIKSSDKSRYKYLNLKSYHDRAGILLQPKDYSKLKSVPISNIFIIQLNDGVEEFAEMNTLEALHKLYPYFMDKVNAEVVLHSGKSVFDGNISEKASEAIATGLFKALKMTKVYLVSGPKEFIVNKILQKS